MKKRNFQKTYVFIAVCVVITGCTTNFTKYNPDAENPGLAIFSNKNFNLLTCYIDGKAWRTQDRRNSGFIIRTNYELYIRRLRTNGPSDTIQFQWGGIYENNPYEIGYIGLVMSVPKNYSVTDFLKAQNGQRLIIDSTVNGYFTTSISRLNNAGLKGNGMLYFNRASYDSIRPLFFSGHLAGLFQADFPNFKITKGRFDHDLLTEMVQDY